MRLWISIYFFAFIGASALAQDTNQLYQQQADRIQLQRLQQDLEISRIQAQTESMRRDSERMTAEILRMDAESKLNKPESLREILNRANEEREAARKAREAADAIEQEKQFDAAKSADRVYLFVIVVLTIFSGVYVAHRARKGGVGMKYEEKFGVVLLIVVALAGLVAIAISDGWDPHMDALQNIMLTLRFRLLAESNSPYSQAEIDLPTKYVLLVLVAMAAYGYTTYLGITPAWKKEMPATSSTPKSEA